MLKVFQKGARIEYTQGDTFSLRISPNEGESFPDGSTLDFIIAEEPGKTVIAEQTFTMEDGVFDISLSASDRQIPYGEYVYKMVLRTAGGIVVTQRSGSFKVKWGA